MIMTALMGMSNDEDVMTMNYNMTAFQRSNVPSSAPLNFSMA
jgi:hypothetical protein